MACIVLIDGSRCWCFLSGLYCWCVCLFVIACVCMLQPFFDSPHVLLSFLLFSFTHSLAVCVCVCVLFENSLLLLICLVCETHPLRCYICTVFFCFFTSNRNGIMVFFLPLSWSSSLSFPFVLSFFLSLLVFFFVCTFLCFSLALRRVPNVRRTQFIWTDNTQTIQNAYESHTHAQMYCECTWTRLSGNKNIKFLSIRLFI